MRRFYILLLFSTICFSTLAQSVQKQMVDYTHSFARNINWPTDKEEYTIRVITQDRNLTAEFDNLAKTKKLKGKPIKVGFSNYVSIPEDVDIIFVSSLYNGALQSIIDRIIGKPILIVTERSPDQQYVMINFIQSAAGGLTFEYNRANIANQNLQVMPEFDLLGGSAIDVAKLYKQARDSVRAMEERSQNVEERIDSLNLQAALAMRIASNQMKTIDEQTKEIERRQQELDRQSATLDSLVTEFKNSQKRLDSLTSILDEREQDLIMLSDEIVLQQANVEEGNRVLQEQEELIELRNKEIAETESRLQEMVTIVDTQQDTLYLLILFSVFLVVVLIFAYRAYQARRRDAKKLNEQKEELSLLLEELQSAQTQLVQSEKMASLGTLTAGIAHEINNAINYVYSGIHILEMKFNEMRPFVGRIKSLDYGDEELREKIKALVEQRNEIEYDQSHDLIDSMVKNIRVGAERTIDIVKGLRTFSRAQEESMDVIDIHDDIEVALLFLKNKLKNNVTVEQNLAKELPTMYGYSGQVGQAILNIISNAIDAASGKEDAKIQITTKVSGEKAIISIKDNGVGIKEEDLDKIFDPFFTTKKIGEGTGLGLSITYGIIEKHHGTIDVKSTLGIGTEFTIELPFNNQPEN